MILNLLSNLIVLNKKSLHIAVVQHHRKSTAPWEIVKTQSEEKCTDGEENYCICAIQLKGSVKTIFLYNTTPGPSKIVCGINFHAKGPEELSNHGRVAQTRHIDNDKDQDYSTIFPRPWSLSFYLVNSPNGSPIMRILPFDIILPISYKLYIVFQTHITSSQQLNWLLITMISPPPTLTPFLFFPPMPWR